MARRGRIRSSSHLTLLARPACLARLSGLLHENIAAAADGARSDSTVLYSDRRKRKGRGGEMKAVKYIKEGVVIPSAWVKGWGKPVVAHRGSQVLILESPARAASRKRLARMVSKLRRATRELGITPGQIAAEVETVRRDRARRS